MRGGKVLWGITLAACMGWSTQVQAEGIVRKVPADGSWVEFKVTGKETDANDPNDVKNAEGKLRVSFVGTTIEDDKKLRWIEFEARLKQDNNPREERILVKVLVPEEELQEGKFPNEHIVRGWRKFVREGRETEARELANVNGEVHAELFDLFLVGPLGEPKKLEPAVIESKLGKQECPGLKGNFAVVLPTPDGQQDLTGNIELRTHDKAPWGVVSYHVKSKEPGSKDDIELKLVLSDFGTDAKSKLPDRE